MAFDSEIQVMSEPQDDTLNKESSLLFQEHRLPNINLAHSVLHE